MKNSMIGLGDPFAQKVIFADAALGMNLPVTFFQNCTPGSSQHMKVLRKHPFLFERTDQVRQLVTSISVKAQSVREVAKEVVCLTLKSDTSLSLYQDVLVKGCDLFSAVLDVGGGITIKRLDNKSKCKVKAKRGGFSGTSCCDYYPQWARLRDVSVYCSNHVRMTSKSNFQFSIVHKTTPAHICLMKKETVHFAVTTVSYSETQVLLNSNKYVHIADPIGEMASYFHVSKK